MVSLILEGGPMIQINKKLLNILQRYPIKPVIPFLFTFTNALFGLYAIIATFQGAFTTAAWCIIAAVIADGIDGRLARYFGTTGELGGELDSLCDAISFCLAPAVLLYTWYGYEGTHAWLFLSAAGFYLCAGLFRLARFNTTDTDQSIFYFGLPTTLAAFFLVQFIFYREWIAQGPFKFVLQEKTMIGILIFVGLLMISSLKFPVFKKTTLPIKKIGSYIKIGAVTYCCYWSYHYDYPLFLIFITGYIMGTLLLNGLIKTKKYLKK